MARVNEESCSFSSLLHISTEWMSNICLFPSQWAPLQFGQYCFPTLLKVRGWVGPFGLFHNAMVYSQTVTSLNANWAQRRVTQLMSDMVVSAMTFQQGQTVT